MPNLMDSEYREINLVYLLKLIYISKIHVLAITLVIASFSIYVAYSLDPVYESKALLKIGQYHKFERNGDVSIKPLDSANELTKELSFLFLGKAKNKSSIVKVSSQKGIENYIEIVSEGLTPEGSSMVIKDVVSYVQKEHSKQLLNIKKQHQVEFNNIVGKVETIITKQKKFLSKEGIYNNKDYSSLLNTLQLMSTLNSDLGMGYIGQMLEKKEKLELLLGGVYEENSHLVGEIFTSNHPGKPRKNVIVFFGFFIGLFLSIVTVFLREYFSKQYSK